MSNDIIKPQPPIKAMLHGRNYYRMLTDRELLAITKQTALTELETVLTERLRIALISLEVFEEAIIED